MITADGRSTVEMEIEQMQFTGLGTREPIFGLDYEDLPVEQEDFPPLPFISFFTRWIENIFHLERPIEP